jgi:hypothetical protein
MRRAKARAWVVPSRDVHAELGQQTADQVDQLGALADQQIARSMQR